MNSDKILWALILSAILLAGGFYYWLEQRSSQAVELKPIVLTAQMPELVEMPIVVEELMEIEESAPVFASMPEQKIVMPPEVVDGSDLYVKKAILDLAPAMQEWIIGSQQLRKWVLLIDLMADGQLMKQDRPLNYPMNHFMVKEVTEETFLASTVNYSRLNLLVNVFVAVDVDLAVYYYKKWSPLLERAYKELGKKGSFHGRIKKSMDRVIQVKPLIENPILIKKGGVLYRYADDQFELATDIEKLMWRMGSANSQKLQDYLKKIRERI